MSLIINKINKGNKGGAFLRFIRLAFFLLVLFGPVVAASMFDLSNCQGVSRWCWIGAFCVLLFIPFILITRPEAAQAWNCARSIAIAGGLAAGIFLIEFLENRIFPKSGKR